jgi:hypothetical protein
LDVKRFHYLVLNCFGPLETLDECIRLKSGPATKPKSKSSAATLAANLVVLLFAVFVVQLGG